MPHSGTRGLTPPQRTLQELQNEVHEWANKQFPGRQPPIAWMKFYEELGEVIRDPKDELEWADLLILILDLAALYGVHNLTDAVLRKMEINRKRVWGTTETGVMKHIPGQATHDASWPWVVCIGGPLAKTEPTQMDVYPSCRAGRAFGVDGPEDFKSGAYFYTRTDFGMDRREIHFFQWQDRLYTQ